MFDPSIFEHQVEIYVQNICPKPSRLWDLCFSVPIYIHQRCEIMWWTKIVDRTDDFSILFNLSMPHCIFHHHMITTGWGHPKKKKKCHQVKVNGTTGVFFVCLNLNKEKKLYNLVPDPVCNYFYLCLLIVIALLLKFKINNGHLILFNS